MKAEESSGAPLEEGPNPQPFPHINQLAKISFWTGIGDIIVGIYMFSKAQNTIGFFEGSLLSF